jgi:hypothetical protein
MIHGKAFDARRKHRGRRPWRSFRSDRRSPLLEKRRLLVQRSATNQVIQVLQVDDDEQARVLKQQWGDAMLDVTIDVFEPGTPMFARILGRQGPPVPAVMTHDHSTTDFTYAGVALLDGVVTRSTLDPLQVRRAFVVFDVVGPKKCGSCGEEIVLKRPSPERTRVYLVEDDAAERPVFGAAFLAPAELCVVLRCVCSNEIMLTLADGNVDLDGALPQSPAVLFARVITLNSTPYRPGP